MRFVLGDVGSSHMFTSHNIRGLLVHTWTLGGAQDFDLWFLKNVRTVREGDGLQLSLFAVVVSTLSVLWTRHKVFLAVKVHPAKPVHVPRHLWHRLQCHRVAFLRFLLRIFRAESCRSNFGCLRLASGAQDMSESFRRQIFHALWWSKTSSAVRPFSNQVGNTFVICSKSATYRDHRTTQDVQAELKSVAVKN